MKVLVIGGGGREHTLIWKIAQSPKVDEIYCAPGNAGISQLAECIGIESANTPALISFAREKKIDLTLVGPEAPLAAGIVDEFEKKGLRIFGPSKAAAEIESSKVFAKKLMQKYGIPTGDGEVFEEPQPAINYIRDKGAPIVVKADGLAAGKGVIVCQTVQEAEEAVALIMVQRKFGEAGRRVIVEECLQGEEASIIAFTDGKTVLPMVSSQDHKRAYDQDKGPNTGGMGAYAPTPAVNSQTLEKVLKEVLIPAVKGMAEEGRIYKGVLYAGIMLTSEGPKALEFNCRFGDPENQVIMPLLETDLVEIMSAIIEERLAEMEIHWNERSAVCVVLASGGYPGKYEKGKEIRGLDEVSPMKDVIVFHAGTKYLAHAGLTPTPPFFTNGGRVLGVTALGDSLLAAIKRAYSAVDKINFEGMHYRKDIGARALPYSFNK
ncbi:phosphoribosylamine--glycine ligase [bacterium]|nr:phosphoribosylamine--glycine ligase [bacterium]MCK4437027.1 phosphoribosylamine--glycine ligase [bacterium]